MDKETSKVLAALVKKLPGDSIKRAADVAITTFEKCISPITASLGGWGELIKARFEAKLEHEKILIAETYERARQKIDEANVTPSEPRNMNVHIAVIEFSSAETDPLKRELLANILANEQLKADVHPEIIRLLSIMTAEEIELLTEIASKEENKRVKDYLKLIIPTITHINLLGFGFRFSLIERTNKFSETLLQQYGLIKIYDYGIKLTPIGKEFIRCVTDPLLEKHTSENEDDKIT
jgi:hypothetical protein